MARTFSARTFEAQQGRYPHHVYSVGTNVHRLNYQHFLTRQQLGALIPPNISPNKAAQYRVADIGAGTWCAICPLYK